MRNSGTSNAILAQSLALALAGAAAWALVVRPLSERLRSLQWEATSVREAVDRDRVALQADDVSASEMFESIADHTRRLQSVCDASSDSAVVYESIGRLAERSGVRVERMEPRRVTVAAATPSRQAPVSKKRSVEGDKKAALPEIEAFGFTIDATGSFAGVAAFIDAIEHEIGLSKAMSFRLMPVRSMDGSSRVRAVIESAHYRLDRPLSVTSAGGGDK